MAAKDGHGDRSGPLLTTAVISRRPWANAWRSSVQRGRAELAAELLGRGHGAAQGVAGGLGNVEGNAGRDRVGDLAAVDGDSDAPSTAMPGPRRTHRHSPGDLRRGRAALRRQRHGS